MNLQLDQAFRRRLALTDVPVFAFLFLVVLWVPILKSVVAPQARYALRDQGRVIGPIGPAKNRTPDSWSSWDRYANERFAGRDVLIHWNNLIQVRLLKVSPNQALLLGRNGWLFLSGPNLEMDYFRGDKPLSAVELELWRRALLQRHFWLKSQGIRFVYVVASNKSSIYPEYVPPRIHRGRTRLDQLVDYLHSRVPPDFLLIDLRPAMWAAKKHYPVYGSFESHWNDFGALAATNKICRVLSRYYHFHPPKPGDFSIELVHRAPRRGDMAAMLALADVMADSQFVEVSRNLPSEVTVTEPAHWIGEHLEREVTTCRGAELPETLVFRDSFGYTLGKYLSLYFRKITFVRDTSLLFHPGVVTKERPQIVIQEIGERFLQIVPPYNPPPLSAIDPDRQ